MFFSYSIFHFYILLFVHFEFEQMYTKIQLLQDTLHKHMKGEINVSIEQKLIFDYRDSRFYLLVHFWTSSSRISISRSKKTETMNKIGENYNTDSFRGWSDSLRSLGVENCFFFCIKSKNGLQ